MTKYVVASTAPYYPSVVFAETLEEAQAKREEILRDRAVLDGKYHCKVVIAEVTHTTEFRSHY